MMRNLVFFLHKAFISNLTAVMMEAFRELAKRLSEKKISLKDIEKIKISVSRKYGLGGIPKNADIKLSSEKMRLGKHRRNILYSNLRTKPVRTGSGVAVIAVMFLADCPGSCIYCPRGKNAPQSYTGVEPATMRAQRAGFDPYRQVENRLKQLHAIGHSTDKCELVIMGGTFPALPFERQKVFVKGCFDALNSRASKTLKHAQKINEKVLNRCVGLTIETRPDYCNKKHIEQMLELGCTRVELGVQTLYPSLLKKIRRRHGMGETTKAIKALRDSGMKICLHMMPGLTGLEKLDMKKEFGQFRTIFEDERFMPDELKIYPVLVMPGTVLHKLWKKGSYKPLTKKQAAKLLAGIKMFVPPYVRIKRIMRDISEKEVAAGPKTTNLRQLVKESGARCRCIRCREPRDRKTGRLYMRRCSYGASGGREFFLSFENKKYIAAFLRLRLMEKKAFVRELHVYGPMIPIGMKGGQQHKGYGRKLLKQAEKIAKASGIGKLYVTSGIGARNYYRKLGYMLEKYYMSKRL